MEIWEDSAIFQIVVLYRGITHFWQIYCSLKIILVRTKTWAILQSSVFLFPLLGANKGLLLL